MKLTPFQLAFLYLLLFNISEGSPDNAEELTKPIDSLLSQNNEPTSDAWIPDHDGCPVNASEETYAMANKMLENVDWEKPIEGGVFSLMVEYLSLKDANTCSHFLHETLDLIIDETFIA